MYLNSMLLLDWTDTGQTGGSSVVGYLNNISILFLNWNIFTGVWKVCNTSEGEFPGKSRRFAGTNKYRAWVWDNILYYYEQINRQNRPGADGVRKIKILQLSNLENYIRPDSAKAGSKFFQMFITFYIMTLLKNNKSEIF